MLCVFDEVSLGFFGTASCKGPIVQVQGVTRINVQIGVAWWLQRRSHEVFLGGEGGGGGSVRM